MQTPFSSVIDILDIAYPCNDKIGDLKVDVY